MKEIINQVTQFQAKILSETEENIIGNDCFNNE